MLRLLQIGITSAVMHGIMVFEHRPKVFVLTGCLEDEHSYWVFKDISVTACFVMIAYGLLGAAVEISVFLVSGRGTPVQTRARRLLVPICKFSLVPMMIIRMLGFGFAIVALFYTRACCSCAKSKLGGLDERLRHTVVCPIDNTDWSVAAHFLVCMMGVDCLYPLLTLLLIMRGRIRRYYHRIRPPKKMTDEEIQQTWEKSCKRCCECSSLLTCYLCGGHKLTAQSYGDVAYALTDFLAGEEHLDIVPSDGKDDWTTIGDCPPCV